MENPVRLATVKMDDLTKEQWDLAILLMQGTMRTFTVQEVVPVINKLAELIRTAQVSWTTETLPNT